MIIYDADPRHFEPTVNRGGLLDFEAAQRAAEWAAMADRAAHEPVVGWADNGLDPNYIPTATYLDSDPTTAQEPLF